MPNPEDKLQNFFNKYLSDMMQFVDDSKMKAVERAAQMCYIFGQNGSTPGIFAEAIYKEFEKTYNESFNTSPAKDKIDQWINAMFKEFRWNDNQTIFPEKFLEQYPKLKNWDLPYTQNLALADRRTKDFLAKSDFMYLGKYVSQDDTKGRMKQWLEREYVDKGTAIGNNKAAIDRFRNEFKELADVEDYKVRRIIDTTVSNSRTFGHLRSLQQVGAESYRIAGPNDNLTCPWCRAMVGKEFNVQKSVNRLDAAIDAGPDYLYISKPFLTGKGKPEDIESASSDALQAMGVEMPPYHCGCRHRIILSKLSDGSVVIEKAEKESAKDAKQAIDNFENRVVRKKNLIEESVVIKNDRIILEKTGTKNQVVFTGSELRIINGSDIMIHNHPRNSSFSKEDIMFAIANEIKEMRVYAPGSVFGNGSYVFKNINIPPITDAIKNFRKRHNSSEMKFIDMEKKKEHDEYIKMKDKELINWYHKKIHQHWKIFQISEEAKGIKFEYYWISKDEKTRN